MDMKERLQELAENARKRIEESEGLDKLNDVRVAYLGKKGDVYKRQHWRLIRSMLWSRVLPPRLSLMWESVNRMERLPGERVLIRISSVPLLMHW